MSVESLEKKYSNLIVILLLMFPILINSVKIFGNLILLILALLGTYIAITEKTNPFKVKQLQIFSWLTVGYFGTMLLSILIADGLSAEFQHLGRILHFLLAPLVALTMLQVSLPLNKLLFSIKLGLIVIGVITTVQFYYLFGEGRVSGMINANIFGDIAVAMLFLSVVQIFRETPKEKTFTFVSMAFGLVAIILSGSRGSWLSFLILSVVYIGLIYRPFLKNNNNGKISLVLLFSVLSVFIATQTNINQRVSLANTEMQSWLSGKNLNDSNGLRLQMWEAGLMAAKQSPWIGYGYRNANQITSEYAPNNKQTIKNKSHLHNEYITTIVSAGIIGLLMLLTLLFFPIIVFYRKLKNKETYYYASMGILLCASYATFSFTHMAFGEEHINAFYVFFLGFLFLNIERNNQHIKQGKSI